MSQIDQAVAYVKGRGYARTIELARHLGMIPGDVDLLLCGQTAFVTCDVQVGDSKLKEYRLSTAPAQNFRAGTPLPPTPPGQASVEPTPPCAKTAAPVPGGTQGVSMTTREKIEAALQAHGPMTARALGEHVKVVGVGKHCADLVGRGILKRTDGDGPRSSVYSLAIGKTRSAPSGRDAMERGGELGRRKPSDSPYAALLKNLVSLRAEKLAEVAKLDGAIDAVRALG